MKCAILCLIFACSFPAFAKTCNEIAISVQRSHNLWPSNYQTLKDACDMGLLVKDAGGDLSHFKDNIEGYSRAQAENLGLDADDHDLGANYAGAIKEAGMLGYRFGT
nr:hypothetical protein [uncultured Pantoea sp.]